MLIEKILGGIQEFNLMGKPGKKALVLLDHYEMMRPHQRICTTEGEHLSISLPKGEQLYSGAVLFADEERIIVVELKEEDILEVYPQGEEQWGKAGFNIGNMHQICYFTENSILLPYDPVIERLLQSMELSYERKSKKLEGKRPNVSAHSHHHPHNHNHTHEHSHEHTDQGEQFSSNRHGEKR